MVLLGNHGSRVDKMDQSLDEAGFDLGKDQRYLVSPVEGRGLERTQRDLVLYAKCDSNVKNDVIPGTTTLGTARLLPIASGGP